MKNLILLSLIMLPFLNFSQSRSSIDFMISPDLTYRFLDAPNEFKWSKAIYDSVEQSKIGTHIGVGYNVKLSSKFWLKMGLQISNMGYRSSLKNAQWGSQNNNGTFNPNLPGQLNYSNALEFYYGFYYFNLPFLVRYELNEKKLSPYFELGLVPSYAVERYIKTVYNNQESKTLNESKNNFAVMLHWGFGINYKLSDKWKLYCQPTIRYQLNSNPEPVKQHLYSIGIELGARMSL